MKATGIIHFSTAEELRTVTGLDDAALRRLSAGVNPETKRPWLPKPVKGRYEREATILGALAWWRAQATRDYVDHPVYADMGEAEARGLIPRSFQQFAKSQGVDFINLNRTVKIEPLRRFAFDILKKAVGSEAIKEILETEGWDSDLELAKLRRQQRLGLERQNAVAEGHKIDKAAAVDAIRELQTIHYHSRNRMIDEWPAMLAGQGAGPIRVHITRAVEELNQAEENAIAALEKGKAA